MMPSRIRVSFFMLLFIGTSLPVPVQAGLELGKLFSDHAVLQRGKAVPVWGRAEAGADVELCLEDQCLNTSSDSTGAWEITLPARKAGGPFRIIVKSGDGQVTIDDVWFGDVWLAGGQSNMEWKLEMGVNDVEAEYADSDYPLIRFFEVENRLSGVEEERLTGGAWKVGSRETVPAFSAVGWVFAKHNHMDKGVAVGVIDNNWGGTPAQAWVSRSGLAKLPAYRDRVKPDYADPGTLARLMAENSRNAEEKYRRLERREEALAAGAHRFGFDDGDWKRVNFPADASFEDILWLRKTFTLDAIPAGGVTLDLGDLVQDAFVFVNEEIVAHENWTDHGSRHDLAPALLRKGENLVAIRLANSWDNRPSLGGRGAMVLAFDGRQAPFNEDWAWSNSVEAPLPVEVRYEHQPSMLYNAMIHPVRRFGMRGVIWYQGESNVGEAALYGDLFKGLILDWRRASGQELPFLFVQLAGFLQHRHPQPDSAWAELRSQQQSALELPLTGMATAFDIGEEFDIHPRNKQDVADRLWLAARRVALGENVAATAPSVIRHRVAGDTVELEFSTGEGVLVLRGGGDFVQAFILAGEDGVFHPANATLDENRVMIRSGAVKSPVALKYAWADFPKVNLYAETGLPVLPFSLDLVRGNAD